MDYFGKGGVDIEPLVILVTSPTEGGVGRKKERD